MAYSSPPTRVPPIAGLRNLQEHHMVVLIETTQFYVKQLELEFDFVIGLTAYAGIWKPLKYLT